jgi:uncharacterized phage protein (TIGR02220 family)
MNILSLLSANSFLVVNKSLARKVGLDSAALFADLAGSQLHWESSGKLVNGYFYRTQQDIEEQTTLSAKTQLRCLRILEDNGLVKTKLIGLPATKHYSIDQSCLDVLLKLFSTKVESSLAEREKLDSTKGIIIENIIIENNNIENIIMEEKAEQSSTLFPEKNTSIENVFEEVEKKPTVKTKCEIPAEEAKYFFEVSQILQEFEALMSVKFKIPETKKLFERYGQANKIIKVLQQGHSLEDCLNVIKLKHSEWFNDSKMRAYIVPDTIFAPNNFGKYLTQLQISNNNPQPQNNGNFNKQQQQQGSRFARSFAKHFAQDANNDVPF